MRRKQIVLWVACLFFITACQTDTVAPTGEPTNSLRVIPSQTQALTLPTPKPPTLTPAKRLPFSEAEVPRVTVENAKAALDAGIALIVDVRSQQAYDAMHIAGAVFIPLVDLESNAPGLDLDKDQWIITYCT